MKVVWLWNWNYKKKDKHILKMKTVDVFFGKKKKFKKWINKLTNVNHIKFGKALFLGKKTGLSIDDNIKTLVTIATLV